MDFHNVRCVLTDIEGTTTSITFVYDELFPFFKTNCSQLLECMEDPKVKSAFEAIKQEIRGVETDRDVLNQLLKWCEEDVKHTQLKALQGILWQKGYESGELKGHVYSDVTLALKNWKSKYVALGVFSSGSVQAQKLLCAYSVDGDLSEYFSHHFDTNTGPKREKETYDKIQKELKEPAENILFLSDVPEELMAAQIAGYQTCQLLRPGVKEAWHTSVNDFLQIELK